MIMREYCAEIKGLIARSRGQTNQKQKEISFLCGLCVCPLCLSTKDIHVKSHLIKMWLNPTLTKPVLQVSAYFHLL